MMTIALTGSSRRTATVTPPRTQSGPNKPNYRRESTLEQEAAVTDGNLPNVDKTVTHSASVTVLMVVDYLQKAKVLYANCNCVVLAWIHVH